MPTRMHLLLQDKLAIAFLHDLSAANFTSESSESLVGRSKDWMNSYFTVYRNPQTSKNSWQKKISFEEQRQIEDMVSDSWAFEFYASLENWD